MESACKLHIHQAVDVLSMSEKKRKEKKLKFFGRV
jgi:hypothetical protein